MTTTLARARTARRTATFFIVTVLCIPGGLAQASEAGHGTFHATLHGTGFGCVPDAVTTIPFTSTFSFDDATYLINIPPGNNNIEINFSKLGVFHDTGELQCVFDVGGTFTSTAVNEAGDFTWIGLDGEYLDRKPGIGEGDVFPWVAGARCETTRTDEFKTLCDNFQLSWNGLSKALAPVNGYNDFGGNLGVRTAMREVVSPGGEVHAPVTVDGPGGSVPEVEVHFNNGVLGAGEVSISTLADAHGSVPPGTTFPSRGTTEIDHGSGAEPFFEGGDERFIDIETDADLPSGPNIEVCLPMPAITAASDVRPVHVLHGEGEGIGRAFVDRTSRIDHASGMACASVSHFSRFAVTTTDLCGKGKRSSDGILTIAGGLSGRKNVIFDGVTDCSELPVGVSRSLAAACIPDGDNVAGQCTVSLKLGVDRAGCNQVADGVDASSTDVNPWSYTGVIRGAASEVDLEPLIHDALVGLADRTEATIGPVDVALAPGKYRLIHRMEGEDPATGLYVGDKDAANILCVSQ